MKFFIFFVFFLSSIFASADSMQFFVDEFKDRDGCFLLVEMNSKKVTVDFRKDVVFFN